MNRTALAACAAALLCVVPLPLAAQEGGGPPAPTIPGLAPTGLARPVDAEDCVITPFRPVGFDVDELKEIAGQLFGAEIEVTDRNPRGERDSSWNTDHFLVFGETFFVRDSLSRGQRILESLAQIDRQEAERNKAQRKAADFEASVAVDDPLLEARAAYQRTELRPRHVALDTLYRALTRYERSLYQEETPQGEVYRSNLTPIGEANLVLVEDVPSRVAEIVDLATRIDRPSPQVHVTALIVETTSGSEAGEAVPAQPLPKELTEALSKMALGTGFRLLSTGALRCALQSQRLCNIGTESGDGSSWKLSFVPESYDAEGRSVALSQCMFHLIRRGGGGDGRNGFEGPSTSQSFETNLTVALGEWVVLGAVGARPVLVALRVETASVPPTAAEGGKGK